MAEHQAREIERLTAERDSVSIECDMLNACNDSLASDLRRLQAERDRLRAALKPFVEDGACPTCSGDCADLIAVRSDCALEAACRALAEGTEE